MNKIIVDVRSIEEWEYDGHSNCSINIPLDQLPEKIVELLSYDQVIFVCRSGGRASVAQSLMRNAGFAKDLQNLGPWQNILCD